MTRDDRAILSGDTTLDAEDVQVRRWREMSPAEKASLVVALCRSADAMALAGIRQRYPAAPARELFLRLAEIKLGRDLAVRAYPEIAALAD